MAGCSDDSKPGTTDEEDPGYTDVPSCGDFVLQSGEVCDKTSFGTNSCANEGFDGGSLTCAADCLSFTTEGCTTNASPECDGPADYRTATVNTDIPDGDPCNTDSDCESGNCNISFYCGNDEVVPTAHAANLPLGMACDDSVSCESGYCWQSDVWICAQPCNTVIESPTGAGLACQADELSSTGSTCLPANPQGGLGEECLAADFDCAEQLCLAQDYCTRICDLSDDATCNDPTSDVATSCVLYTIEGYGDYYLCIPDNDIGGAAEGEACESSVGCNAGLNCFENLCRTTCGDEQCAAGTFCTSDSPDGAVCLPDGERLADGDACEYHAHCPDSSICFDAGAGALCHSTCPNGDECTGSSHCVQASIGIPVDTVISIYDADNAEEPILEDDDGGEGLFSMATLPLTTGAADYWISVTHYAGSAEGDYILSTQLNTGLSGATVAETTAANDTLATAQTITLGDLVTARFTDTVNGEEIIIDIDTFKVSVNPAGADNLVITTSASLSGVCLATDALAADGAVCTNSASCENECFPHMRNEAASFCASACLEDTDCTSGTCSVFTENGDTQGYCFAAGDVTKGEGVFGSLCAGPHECTSNVCIQHKFSDEWRCGDSCTGANTACATTAGMCSDTNPIYGTGCVPHLDHTVPEAGACAWSVDCVVGTECLAERCQPVGATSRYEIITPVANGLACNMDEDCGEASFCDAGTFTCTSMLLTGCMGDSDNVIDEGEFCDGTNVGTATCESLGLGTGGTLSCDWSCTGYDITGCTTGQADGQPCNADDECDNGYCFAGGNTWFCASPCTDEADTSCTGTLFASALPVSCQAVDEVDFACVPTAGIGETGAICSSDYLDCAGGYCFDGSFCIEECSLTDNACGREALCVTYERRLDPARFFRDTADSCQCAFLYLGHPLSLGEVRLSRLCSIEIEITVAPDLRVLPPDPFLIG